MNQGIKIISFLCFGLFGLQCQQKPNPPSKRVVDPTDYCDVMQDSIDLIMAAKDKSALREGFEKRIRFFNIANFYLCMKKCAIPWGSNPLNKPLLKTLGSCNIPRTKSPYSLLQKICMDAVPDNVALFTLDFAQKDSSVLIVSSCLGDWIGTKGESTNYGIVFCFKQSNSKYELQDIILGRLGGFDVAKNNQLMPLIIGRTLGEYDSQVPEMVETRFRWNGNHLQADALISAHISRSSDPVLTVADLKKKGLYDHLQKMYVANDTIIDQTVGIHYPFRGVLLEKQY
ncbi:MAG: hypothetical protein RL329_970 [Bacteroidota bacterium]|jgi:hypothetical protein